MFVFRGENNFIEDCNA